MKRLISTLLAALFALALVASAAPTAGAGGRAVRVAVIDTGISSIAIDGENLAEGTTTSARRLHGGHPRAWHRRVRHHRREPSAGVAGLCPEAVLVPLSIAVKRKRAQF